MIKFAPTQKFITKFNRFFIIYNSEPFNKAILSKISPSLAKVIEYSFFISGWLFGCDPEFSLEYSSSKLDISSSLLDDG